MTCFLCNNKLHIKEDFPKNKENKKKKKINKESSIEDNAMIEAGYKEEIVDGELLNWENLNLNNF